MSDALATIPKLPQPEKRRGGGRPSKQPIVAGNRYGTWIAIAPSDVRKSGHAYWECRCDCGTQRPVAALHLRSGKSSNCGCLKASRFAKMATKHGQTGTRTHRIWQLMKSRCSNSNLPDYKHYGGRGIKVCERWQTFENFLSDMGEAPAGLSIDRIKNDKGYEPGNCRWATAKQQANNLRRNVRLTLRGRTQTISEWADELGVSASLLRWRYDEGWNDRRILTTPSRKDTRLSATVDGETLTIRQWAGRTGLPYSTMISRIERGWIGREVVYGRSQRG